MEPREAEEEASPRRAAPTEVGGTTSALKAVAGTTASSDGHDEQPSCDPPRSMTPALVVVPSLAPSSEAGKNPASSKGGEKRFVLEQPGPPACMMCHTRHLRCRYLDDSGKCSNCIASNVECVPHPLTGPQRARTACKACNESHLRCRYIDNSGRCHNCIASGIACEPRPERRRGKRRWAESGSETQQTATRQLASTVAFATLPYGVSSQVPAPTVYPPGFYPSPVQPLLAGFLPTAMPGPAAQPSQALATRAPMLSYMVPAVQLAAQQGVQPEALHAMEHTRAPQQMTPQQVQPLEQQQLSYVVPAMQLATQYTTQHALEHTPEHTRGQQGMSKHTSMPSQAMQPTSQQPPMQLQPMQVMPHTTSFSMTPQQGMQPAALSLAALSSAPMRTTIAPATMQQAVADLLPYNIMPAYPPSNAD